jgi:putative photosynthetic complex assembly protein 2
MVVRGLDGSTVSQAGLMLVSTLLAMAIVEHWLLVLPLQSTALWRWAMRHREPGAPAAAALGKG